MPRLKAKPPSCEVIFLSEENSSAVQDNIAPIFLRTKRSCDEVLIQKSALLPRSPSLETVSTDVCLQRGQLQPPPSALRCRLLEIQSAHAAFPVRASFSSLQRRAGPRLQQAEDVSQQPAGEKRKQLNEISPRVPKRLRPSLPAVGADDPGHCHLSAQDVHNSLATPEKKQPRSSKLSRSYRLKARSEISAGLVDNREPKSGGTNHSQPDKLTPKTSDSFQKVLNIEDRLWTEKYCPQHSSDVIGNSASLTKLHSWLKRWKLRADRDNRRRHEETREDNQDGSWDCGDFQGEAGSKDDREEPLCNAMLITGPPGMGKTASVYACAQEFGFKVFEVNSASQRSGRHVLSQLKEATQSHLVETSGKDPLKPAYLNLYNTSSTNKSELHGTNAVPKTATSFKRKTATRSLRCSARKIKTQPTTANLTHYFKMQAKADHCHFGGLLPPEKTDKKALDISSLDSDQTLPQNKKTATSLILFEEVDVIFDDDVGFLAAIKAFMTTTKRPVVLTTNDPSFRKRFDCSLEEIIYKCPSAASVCSYLQRVCLAEKVEVDVEDISCLLRLSSGDVRRCLLQLQLWVQSRGRSHNVNMSESGSSSDLQLVSGCSAFMLGLQPATLQFLLTHLKCPSWPGTEINELLRLLAESWKRGVPLLYTNLELLLDTGMFCGLQNEPSVSQDDVNVKQSNQEISPNESVQRVKNNSKRNRRKNSLTAFGASPFSKLTRKHPRTSLSLNGTCSRVTTERKASKTVTDCLDGLADFFDLMSWSDASLPVVGKLVGSCETFVWTGAELKDSLLDEMSEEDDCNWSQERLPLELKAACEGLGCRRCRWRVSEAQTEAQSYRRQLDDQTWKRLMQSLAVKGSSKKNNLSFSVLPLCAPSVSQRRYKLSRAVLSSKYFRLQGNREAVSVDYMPFLRFVCRSRTEQQHNEEPARCLNYLSRKDLGISTSTMQLLAEDF